MRIFFILLCLSLSAQINAVELCERTLTFKNVEVFRRNNNLGQQQIGDINLEKWFEIGPLVEGLSNYIGLTKEGKVYHLVQWKDRKIARLLSGKRQIKEISLSEEGLLKAIDDKNERLVYSAAKWNYSPARMLLKKVVTMTSAVTASSTAVLALIFPEVMDMGLHISELTLPFIPVLIASATAMETAFFQVNRFDQMNTYTDGFVSLNAPNKEDLIDSTDWSVKNLEALPKPVEEATEAIR